MPECWFCGVSSAQQSREHIFSKTIQKQIPREELVFNPTSYASRYGYQPHHKLGPFTGNNLVVTRVCSDCNNGWMSSLEPLVVKEFFESERLDLENENSIKLAHWFMKTAALFNVSQPTRLCWTATDRKRLISGPIKNASVFLFKTEHSTLNWLQGGVMLADSKSDWCTGCVTEYMALTHQIAIQVGQYVGIVVYKPWQISNSKIITDGLPLWNPSGIIDYHKELKIVRNMSEPKLRIRLQDSSFFQIRNNDSCRKEHNFLNWSGDKLPKVNN